MKGYRFYQEFGSKTNKRKKTPAYLTVVAVLTDTRWVGERSGHFDAYYDAVGGLFEADNSSCCGTTVCEDYLREQCKHVGEARAREIHPALFEYLDE